MSGPENLGENERPLSKEELQELVSPKIRENFEFTDEEIAELNKLPPATEEELEAIRNETPEQSEAAAKRIFEQALDEVLPFANLKRRLRCQSPN